MAYRWSRALPLLDSAFRKAHGDSVLVGCGTVMNVAEAQDATTAGAQFIVTPVLIPEVIADA